MRYYEKTNGQIALIDFSSPQSSNGKLVIKLNHNKLTYHVCILRNDEIRLYDIKTTNHVSSLPSHYQTYSETNKLFLRLGKTDIIQFFIPADYALNHQEQKILQFIDHLHNLKDELSNNNNTFFDIMIDAYHQHALSFIEVALNTLDLNQLKNALAIHWSNINGNALCYTALPNDPITTLFCDIAQFLAPQLNSTAISLLMPTVSTESQFDDFPDLRTIDLKTVLSTHILSENGNYLIPLSLLSKREMKADAAGGYPQFEIATIDVKKLMSPYYQYDLHGDQPYLINETVERLFTYCSETEVIFDAIKQHQAFMQDDQNLLGQLMRLAHLLKQNSVNGLGQELEAGKNGFVAITVFFDYYNQLTNTQQSKIPEEIKSIIDKILRYGTEPTRQQDGTIVDRSTEIGTCIASISTSLFEAISKAGHQQVLSNISISKQKKGKLLRQLEIQFQHGQIELNKKIQTNCCHGHDPLHVTPNVLTLLSLENKFSIDSEHELEQFMKLSANEIAMLCTEMSDIQYEIVDIINNAENLVSFIFEHSDEKISALLPAIRRALFDIEDGILIFPRDIGLILGPFENSKFDMLLSVFINHIRANVKKTADLITLETHLNMPQRSAVYGKLIDILPNLVECTHDFHHLAKRLNDTQLAHFYEASKNHLARLMKSAKCFRHVTQHLNAAQCTDFFQLNKIKIPALIRYGSDFEELTTDLNDEQRCEIFDKIQPRLLWLITEAFEFNYLAKNLNIEKRAALYNSVKDLLPPFIDTAHNFYLIIEYLNPAQQFFICEKLHCNILNLIQGTQLLDSKQVRTLNQAVEHYLVTLFFNLFPSLPQGSIKSIQDMIHESAASSKNQSRLFSARSGIGAALEEISITNDLHALTVPVFYEKINVYLSAMENNKKSGSVRRQR